MFLQVEVIHMHNSCTIDLLQKDTKCCFSCTAMTINGDDHVIFSVAIDVQQNRNIWYKVFMDDSIGRVVCISVPFRMTDRQVCAIFPV